MRLRLTPREDSYYDLFADSANNLVTASRLLVEIISEGSDRKPWPRRCALASTPVTNALMRS